MKMDYTRPPLAYLLRAAQEEPDQLSEAARLRAELAGQFLGYERVARVIAEPHLAAAATAELVALAIESPWEIEERLSPEWLCEQIVAVEMCGPPCVYVTRLQGPALGRLLAGPPSPAGKASFPEIVDWGGIVSLHRDDQGELIARARTMVLDYDWC